MKRLAALACTFALAASTAPANATGFTDIGQDITPRQETHVDVDGYFRLRSAWLYNLDLDRGLTPSGKPLFPVPLADPKAQMLRRNDMRLRTDVNIYAPGGGFVVKTRIDVIDNLALGSTPDGMPAASTTQKPPGDAFRIKRAYAETLTPVGLLAAGRMGSQWGLGMLANGGDCADCDSGDAADRIAFITPLAGFIWAVAYDFSAIGPQTQHNASSRPVDLEPSDDVQSVTFAVLRWRNDLARQRRRKAGKTTFEYGAYGSHRWQDRDIPATYLDIAEPVMLTRGAVMTRNYRATAVDGWFRVTAPGFRVEAEAAYLHANVEQASLVPGALFREPVTSNQIGAAFESEAGDPDGAFGIGLDLGYASGDDAYGFGAFPDPNAKTPRPGDLDGPQANPPRDRTVDNFRFHPDYRVDRILFREIIGTVTDATYVRPHARVRLFRAGPGEMAASFAALSSWAVQPRSTPGGTSALGVELDPTVYYASRDGFGIAVEQATLFPQSGLDNTVQHLRAKPAQLWRLRLTYAF
jgi:uncharacterized protein (TIGR04551 family)